jgi:RNA polymerase sigma-70 factor, ECF subfamily
MKGYTIVILLQFILAAENHQLTALIGEYSKDLYRFAYRLTLNKYDADDLFQQTWLKAVNNFGMYKEKNFKAWIYQICSNQFKDNYRKAQSYRKVVKDDYATVEIKQYVIDNAKSDEDTFAKVENRETKVMLLEKLDCLPPKKRQPLYMFYYQALSYEQIGSALDIPVGTVRSRIFSAKQDLKKQMEAEAYV